MSERFIDKYEIVSTLGRGSMGVVYKGRDPEIGRLVAIKTLKSIFMGDDPAGNEALQRFRQESRSAGKLHHPNIVTIFEAGRTDNGSPFIVMEYIEGQSLETIISEGQKVEALGVLHYLAQIANAIDYAHTQNVIHRDIKPSNILIDGSERAHLLDFGVAKLSDSSLTPAGTVVGTPSYMSPEQIRGATLDGRTDLFSLAVVAYEAFTGVRPFPGSDFTTVVSNIIHKEPIPFKDLDTKLPVELEAVLRKGLAKDRDERFSNALEFVDSTAKVLSVIVDGNGIVGGYKPGMTVEKSAPEVSKTTTKANSVGVEYLTQGSAGSEDPQREALDEQSDTHPSNPIAEVSGEKSVQDSGGSVSSDKPIVETVELQRGQGSSWLFALVGLVLLCLLLFGGVYLLRPEMLGLGEDIQVVGVKTTEEINPVQQIEVVQLPEQNLNEATDAEVIEEPEQVLPIDAVEPSPQASTEAPVVPEPEEVDVVVPEGGFTSTTIAALNDASLLVVLGDENIDVKTLRLAVAEAARRAPATFLEPLVTLLGHPHYAVRVSVLKGISVNKLINDPNVQAAVIGCLDEEDPLVRGFAAKVLAGAGSDLARMALEAQYSKEQDKVVRKVIKQSLGKTQ